MKIEIIPAILPKDFAEVEEKMGLVQGLTKNVQIDICDGQFVQNATWPYKKQDDSFEKILREEIGLPGWEKTNFEIDLMVNHPEKVIEDWVIAGAQRIIIHAEARGDVAGAISSLNGRVEIGLALAMETSLDLIESYQDKIQCVQLMGIDHIGFQGQHFNEKVIERVREVKSKYPDLSISVDGGVSLETAPLLIEAGVDRLVVGSTIFGSDNPIEALQKFKKLNS